MASTSPEPVLPVAQAQTYGLQTDLAELSEQARDYAQHSRANATLRAYRRDWQQFSTWCEGHGLAPLPAAADTLVLYLTAQAQAHPVSSLRRYMASISVAHQAAGYPAISLRTEPLRSVWEGIVRTHGSHQEGKAAAVIQDLRRMVSTCTHREEAAGDRLIDVRDRALLLLGFASACRRSELVSLDVGDVRFTSDGAVLTLRRSKTDQEGAGEDLPIPWGSHPDTCPVRALQAWLAAAGIQEGALFRPVNRHGQLQTGRLSDRAVALIVKARAEKAGLDPAQYAGHSLRSGHVTTAAAAGVPERLIMNQTRHRSTATVRRYIRRGNLFRESSAPFLGL